MNPDVVERWRLVLGRFSRPQLSEPADEEGQRRQEALDALYDKAYESRGVRGQDGEGPRQGGLGPGQMTVPEWVQEVRTLFPRQTSEVVERTALEKFGLTELLTDPEFLERVEPDPELLAQALAFARHLSGPAREAVVRLAERVVEDLRQRLEPEARRVLFGRLGTLHDPVTDAPVQAHTVDEIK